MANHVFGGDWTTDKLERVRKYLSAYTTIFRANPRARFFTTLYVDAFAGSGEHVKSTDDRRPSDRALLFSVEGDEDKDEDAASIQKGSARIALEVDPPFDRFIFVEQNQNRAAQLEKLRSEYPNRAPAIQIENDEANSFLIRWCQETDWKLHRAVVFLDPYGMQVDWTTIVAIAQTKAVDLWLLVPLGIAVNRLLTRHEHPPEQWAKALTRMFGTEDWKKAFYQKQKAKTLFGAEENEQRIATLESVGEFFLKRLKTVFEKVAENPLILSNSRGIPIYLLCFAAGNPKGAPPAVKIASSILK